MFAVGRLHNFSVESSLPQTASYLLSPRYYREIFPTPAVIIVVNAVLPLSPLPCHPLLYRRICTSYGIRLLSCRKMCVLDDIFANHCAFFVLSKCVVEPAWAMKWSDSIRR